METGGRENGDDAAVKHRNTVGQMRSRFAGLPLVGHTEYQGSRGTRQPTCSATTPTPVDRQNCNQVQRPLPVQNRFQID